MTKKSMTYEAFQKCGHRISGFGTSGILTGWSYFGKLDVDKCDRMMKQLLGH